MKTFGERLKEERERLGLGQTALAELGGVKKLAQINYEKNKRNPDSCYLDRVRLAGVDLAYLFSGVRGGDGQALGAGVDMEEKALLDNYRNCQPDQRSAIRAASAAFAEQATQSIKGGNKAKAALPEGKKPRQRA